MSQLDDQDFHALCREFLANVGDRVEAMEDIVDRLSGPPPEARDALGDLKFEAHKLRGSGASFGYPEITRVAGDLEDYLEEHGCDATVLGRLIGALKAAVTGDDVPKA
jgi:chemotaxis protein histidine kinase CheA